MNLDQLWASARDVYDDFLMAFANPRDLAVSGYVRRELHAQMADWLRNLETLVRRLIIIAASALQLAPLPPRAQRRRIPGLRLEYADVTETWRVSLPMFLPRPRARLVSTALPVETPEKRIPPVISCDRLARRLEAVRRILVRPDAYAKRFARWCARQRASTSNAPREFRLRPWSFAPETRTAASHAVAPAMFVAIDDAGDALWRLLKPG